METKMSGVFNNNPEQAKILGEWKSQISPDELPDTLPFDFPVDVHPLPWKLGQGRGNGHIDIFAANGSYVAHVYCWDNKDWVTLESKLSSINGFSGG